MNENQLRHFIRQSFALQAREGQIIKGQNPALMQAMAKVRRIVETLPAEGTLFREQAWIDALPQVRNALRPYNEEFANQLRNNLIEEAPNMAEEASKMVEAVGAPVAPQVPASRAVPSDLGRLPTADNVAAALKSRVNGKRVADLFEQRGSLLMSDWMRSNERAINNVVTRGIFEATSTDDIANGIVQIIQRQGVEYVNTMGPTAARKIQSDAKAIARTAIQDANRQVHEVVWDANADALEGLKWEWVAALDSRTCPICAPLDGQRWDSREEAGNWPAHVNCVLGDTEILAGSIVSATRAVYWGDVVTIGTQGGRNVSVTAQHPMLTDRGWVPAIEIRNGANLIGKIGSDKSGGGDSPNLNQKPATAQQIFDALGSANPMGALTVPPSSMHFHGDGAFCKGNVDVIWADRLLQDAVNAKLGDGITDLNLVGGSRGTTASTSLGTLDQLGLACNAAATGLVSTSRQAQALFKGTLSHADEHRLSTVARRDMRLSEVPLNGAPCDTKVLSECIDTFAAHVEIDEVISVEIDTNRHGVFVYDFTTLSSSYMASDLLVHNCRCRVVAVDPEDAADVRSGIAIRDPKKGKPFSGDRAYATKVKVDGKKFYRKSIDIKPVKGSQVTYGDYLHSSNELSREKFFGSKAKAQRFMDLVDKRSMEPRTALMNVIDGDKFKPDSKLGKLPNVKKKPIVKPKVKVKVKVPTKTESLAAEKAAKAKSAAAAKTKAAAEAKAKADALAKQQAAKAKAEAAALAKFKAEQAAVEKAKAEAKKAKAALEAEKAKQKAAAEAKAKKAAELAQQKAKAEAAAKKAAEAKAKADAASKAAAEAKVKPTPVSKKPKTLTSEEVNATLKKAQAAAKAQEVQAKAIASKAKADAAAAKAQATKKATSEKALNKQNRTADTNYDYDKNWEKLGYEKKSQYRKAKEDIVEWSGNEFEGVRAAQFADARDRGVELNDYERLQTRRLEKGEQRTAGNRARRLEDFIDRAPKYDGTIRRGVAMDTREEVMSTIERYNSGKKNLAIESWTSDQSVSHRFAMGNGDPRPQRMSILVEGNTKGVPINKISGFDDEFEVLVPSGVRYEVVDVKETFVKGNPKGGPATKMDHTDWTVTLKEVKD